MVLALPSQLQGLPASLDKPAAEKVNAWVCRGVTCLAPIADREQLKLTIGAASHPDRTA